MLDRVPHELVTMTFQLFALVRILLSVLVCALALWYWSRSRRSGFAWISGAFFVAVGPALSYSVVLLLFGRMGPRSPFFSSIVRLYPAVDVLSEILFMIFILLGLQAFLAEFVSTSARPLYRPPSSRTMAVQIRRCFFGITGMILVIVGPSAAWRSGSLAGVGVTAVLIGLVCLWLSLHPQSPLVQTASGKTGLKSDMKEDIDSRGADARDAPSADDGFASDSESDEL